MLEMNPEIRKQWCAALRSGEYTQAQKKLRVRNEDGTYSHCCLGVLTDLYIKAGHPEEFSEDIDNETMILNVWEEGTLAVPVTEWAGLQCSNPTLETKDARHSAAEWNDEHGANFAKIADMIDGGEKPEDSLAAKLKASLVIKEPKS